MALQLVGFTRKMWVGMLFDSNLVLQYQYQTVHSHSNAEMRERKKGAARDRQLRPASKPSSMGSGEEG
ncbi:hypothetical protein PABG_06983 [Paracoccidioides brasiliensis Pb03]|nr:hypothetical protein PABG_06983 [Paracoccidioides brasiliensis Pb03]